jgi:hypothetical protein
LQLQQANIKKLSEEASEELIVDDKGEEQDDEDDDNQADEQILAKIAIPNVNKAVTMTVELTYVYFIIDIVPLMELGVRWLDIVM